MTAQTLVAVFAVFGFLLAVMSVIQMIFVAFVEKDTKYIYITFIGVLIFLFIGVITTMVSL